MIVLLLVLASGGLLRFVRLSQPPTVVFDETYYAKDACLYLGYGQDYCNLKQSTEQSYVHPPLGKWIIAVGIKIFGYNSFGWRVMSAVFGTLMILLIYLLARKLFKDAWIAAVAGFLVGTDFLLLVQSRIAMLDIFQAFFVVLGFLFLAFDRERLLASRDHYRLPFPGEPPAREIEWRFAAGSAFGLALAVKWSALWALLGALAITAVWIVAQRRFTRSQVSEADHEQRMAQQLSAPKRSTLWEVVMSALALLVVPVIIYLTSYSSYFADQMASPCPYRGPEPVEYVKSKTNPDDIPRLNLGVAHGQCKTGVVGTSLAFVDLQQRMLAYHLTLKATHTYKSKAWTWPLVKRPIAYYFEGTPKATHILAFGNPATWWASLLAAIWLLFQTFRPSRWRPERLVALGWGTQYLPWLLVTRPLFFFYMTPVVPFMMIALAGALGALREKGKIAKWFVWGYLAIGVVGLLIYFYPVIAAVGLRRDLWQSRMWFSSWI
ncbi:MAG: dolichyl-phosphate-mannose--protein mannosyltransferase [Actinomycetota bacterium]